MHCPQLQWHTSLSCCGARVVCAVLLDKAGTASEIMTETVVFWRDTDFSDVRISHLPVGEGLPWHFSNHFSFSACKEAMQ